MKAVLVSERYQVLDCDGMVVRRSGLRCTVAVIVEVRMKVTLLGGWTNSILPERWECLVRNKYHPVTFIVLCGSPSVVFTTLMMLKYNVF